MTDETGSLEYAATTDGGSDGDLERERSLERERVNEPDRERETERRRDRFWTWAWRFALLSPLAIPWVFVWTMSATLVFPWGMVTPQGRHVTSLPAYLSTTAGLPRHLQMWPLGAACYAIALGWAAGERFGADQRVTAGFLVLSAFAGAWMAAGLGVELTRTAVPTGSLVLFVLAVWAYLRA